MAKKNPTPILTHTEIYSRAIRDLEREIDGWKDAGEGAMLEAVLSPLNEKLKALKTLYKIESGSEY